MRGEAEANRSEIPHYIRNKLRNLAFSEEIATHPSDARNDWYNRYLQWLLLDLGRIKFFVPGVFPVTTNLLRYPGKRLVFVQ